MNAAFTAFLCAATVLVICALRQHVVEVRKMKKLIAELEAMKGPLFTSERKHKEIIP